MRVPHHPLSMCLACNIARFSHFRSLAHLHVAGLPFPVRDLGNVGTVIALMAFARHKGVNLSVLGIGVDFLQVRRAPTPGSPPWAVRSCRMHWDGSFACSQDAVGPLDGKLMQPTCCANGFSQVLCSAAPLTPPPDAGGVSVFVVWLPVASSIEQVVCGVVHVHLQRAAHGAGVLHRLLEL